MLRLRYTSGKVSFEVEAGNQKQAFEAIAEIQEVFEESECGCCKSKDVRFDVREFDGNSYYKMLCGACGAVFDFGQYKEGGGLFGKRWDKDNHRPLPNRGWYIYQGRSGQDSQRPDSRGSQSRPGNNHSGAKGDPKDREEAADDRLVKRWYEFVGTDPDLGTFNTFLKKEYIDWPRSVKEIVKKHMMSHANAVGWVWSAALGEFENPRDAEDSSIPF